MSIRICSHDFGKISGYDTVWSIYGYGIWDVLNILTNNEVEWYSMTWYVIGAGLFVVRYHSAIIFSGTLFRCSCSSIAVEEKFGEVPTMMYAI